MAGIEFSLSNSPEKSNSGTVHLSKIKNNEKRKLYKICFLKGKATRKINGM